MKAAKVLSVLLAGAMSTGVVFAETGSLQKMKERWEKRQTQREEIREKIEGELKKQDAELDKVQKDLKSASEDKKIDALTAAVNTLIDQRRELHQTMESLGSKFKQERQQNGQLFNGESSTQQPGSSALPGNGSSSGSGTGSSAAPSPAPAQ